MGGKSFAEKIHDVVRQIPRGKVLTYAEVAQLAGSPRAARAVGNILKRNYDPEIPCHRVICSNGNLGNYNRGIHEKRRLLQDEGYCV